MSFILECKHPQTPFLSYRRRLGAGKILIFMNQIRAHDYEKHSLGIVDIQNIE